MNLTDAIENYMTQGITNLDAIAKVCGEIILYKISKSSTAKNVTIKGGIVMMNISNDIRRSTRDLDLDFIRYSLSDTSIIEFIHKLNDVDNEININIIFPIEELKHQDYKGKRVNIELIDNYENNYKFKLDIGVHKNVDLEQKILCFNLNSVSESVMLFANSKEQILSEKLKSLLRFGSVTGRYKDIFDIYYLIMVNPVDKNRFMELTNEYIISDKEMWENDYNDIYNRLYNIFKNKTFIELMSSARDNWLEVHIEEVVKVILDFFESLIPVSV